MGMFVENKKDHAMFCVVKVFLLEVKPCGGSKRILSEPP